MSADLSVLLKLARYLKAHQAVIRPGSGVREDAAFGEAQLPLLAYDPADLRALHATLSRQADALREAVEALRELVAARDAHGVAMRLAPTVPLPTREGWRDLTQVHAALERMNVAWERARTALAQVQAGEES